MSSDSSTRASSPTSCDGFVHVPTENTGTMGEVARNKLVSMDEGIPRAETVSTSNTDIPSNGATGGIDMLLQRHRNEIMFELRRLQLGERPVTGQGHKEAVESFFTRAMNADTMPSCHTSENRPEEVRVEVNALVERRPVSSLLQNNSAFRRNLESALRGAIGQLRSPQRVPRVAHIPTPPIPPPTNDQPSSVRPRPYTRRTQEDSESSSDTGRPRPLPAPRQRSRRISHPRVATEPTRVVHESSIPAAPEPTLPAATGPARAQQWLTHHVDVPTEEGPNPDQQLFMRDLLDQARQEDFISDISELVHRQLVTSTLDSNFRERMEHLMQGRMAGQRVDSDERQRISQLIQSLPPRRVPRNDFSHLGIPTHAWSDPLDDISVISATAAVTVPYAQSSQAMSREMNGIKSQLAELKNMMRMNFDLQLDIQRAIRQEVAAAVNNVISDMSGDAVPSVSPGAEFNRCTPARENHCLICLDKFVDSVLYRCGHMCVCYPCGMNLQARGAHCPVCRAPIRDIIRAYKSNTDADQ